MERPLERLGGLLRLAAVTLEALLGCAAALSGFRVVFDVLFGARHGVLLCFVWVFGDGSVPKHTRQIPSPLCARCRHWVTGSPGLSGFLLSTLCGIHTCARFCPFPRSFARRIGIGRDSDDL